MINEVDNSYSYSDNTCSAEMRMMAFLVSRGLAEWKSPYVSFGWVEFRGTYMTGKDAAAIEAREQREREALKKYWDDNNPSNPNTRSSPETTPKEPLEYADWLIQNTNCYYKFPILSAQGPDVILAPDMCAQDATLVATGTIFPNSCMWEGGDVIEAAGMFSSSPLIPVLGWGIALYKFGYLCSDSKYVEGAWELMAQAAGPGILVAKVYYWYSQTSSAQIGMGRVAYESFIWNWNMYQQYNDPYYLDRAIHYQNMMLDFYDNLRNL